MTPVTKIQKIKIFTRVIENALYFFTCISYDSGEKLLIKSTSSLKTSLIFFFHQSHWKCITNFTVYFLWLRSKKRSGRPNPRKLFKIAASAGRIHENFSKAYKTCINTKNIQKSKWIRSADSVGFVCNSIIFSNVFSMGSAGRSREYIVRHCKARKTQNFHQSHWKYITNFTVYFLWLRWKIVHQKYKFT